MIFYPDGRLKVDYDFVATKAVNPRQIGMVFTLDDSLRMLSWRRDALWTTYPTDHIGRTSGTAKATSGQKPSGPAGPSWQPNCSYSQDMNELGSCDFRSTKMNVLWSVLRGRGGGVAVFGGGTVHTRSWLDANAKAVKLLAANYSNLGAERFFRGHARPYDRPLKKGGKITGSVTIALTK